MRLILLGATMPLLVRALEAMDDLELQTVNVGTPGHIDYGKNMDTLMDELWNPHMINIPERPEMPGRLVHDEPSWTKLNKSNFSKKARRSEHGSRN